MALFGSAGSGGFAGTLGNAVGTVWQSAGEAVVRVLGLKTGESALDDNPFRGEALGADALFRRRLYRVTFPWRTGLTETALVPLYRDLAKYAEAGIGFHDALSRLETVQPNAAMRRVIREIREDLVAGATLGEALRRHEYLFDALHVALVEVGESLGTVAENMRMLIEIVQEKEEIRRAIRRRMAQPIVLVFLANYVLTLPIFMLGGVLAYVGAILPPTLFFLFAVFSFVVLFPVLGAAIGPRMRDRLLIDIPVFGSIARQNALARFSRALGAAIGAGVEIDRSLRMAARATGNEVMRDAVVEAIPLVGEHGLAEGLERAGVLPRAIASEVAHGETTGTLAPTLLTIAKDARDRAAHATNVVGGMLAFAVLAVSALYAVFKSLGVVLGGLGSLREGGGFGGGPFDPFRS